MSPMGRLLRAVLWPLLALWIVWPLNWQEGCALLFAWMGGYWLSRATDAYVGPLP